MMNRFLDRLFKKPLTDVEREQLMFLLRTLVLIVIAIIVVGTLIGVIINTFF